MTGLDAPTPRRRRPWYVYLFLAVIGLIYVGALAMAVVIIFFGLIAGW
jgi:hypothetical protein